MSPQWTVLAAGELITDHLFLPGDAGRSEYAGARGGGSVFNIAAGLASQGASQGVRVLALGAGGDDLSGRVAVADLQAAGADAKGLALLRRRRTRLIFERVGHGPTGAVGGTAHSFKTACPVCGQRDTPRARATFDGAASSLMPVAPTQMVILDRLSPARLRLARAMKAQGAATVLDLGAVDYLRYSPAVEILASLGDMDLVVMAQTVERSLLARAGLRDTAELADTTGVGLLMVTRGAQGITLVAGSRGERQQMHLRAPSGPVRDDAGAGDALLSTFILQTLDHLVQSGTPQSGERMFSGALDEIVHIATRSLDRLPAALAVYGARGHLPFEPPLSPYDRHVGLDTDQLLETAHQIGACPICTLPIDTAKESSMSPGVTSARSHASSEPDSTSSPRRTVKTGASRNVDLLLSRVLRTAEDEAAASAAADLLADSGTGYALGSGGSYTAAAYLSTLMRQRGQGPFLMAAKPTDFMRTNRAVDVVVGITYSGGTSDIGHALDHAKQIGVRRLVLLTAARRPKLAAQLRILSEDTLISYGPLGNGAQAGIRERGFVSIAATVMPTVPFVRALHDTTSLVELASRLSGDRTDATAGQSLASFRDARELLIVGGGWASASMVDIESKFAEADLGAVRLEEPKDFSHGRFISALGAGPREGGKQPVLMLFAGEPSKYEESLRQTLLADGHPLAVIRSDRADEMGGLELLCRVQQFAQAYGERRGIDISRPDPPPSPDGLRLYRSRARPV